MSERTTRGEGTIRETAVQPWRKKSRRLLLKMALLLFAGCVGLTLGEVALRIIAPQPPSWLDVYRRHPTLDVFALQPDLDRLVDTGETRWTVYTDGSGFRISKGQNDDVDLPVALCLGDSFTFAHGVDHRDSFVGLLNADEARRYRFVNAAVPAYGPVQYRQTLEYLLEQGLNPRVVLVATFMGNDFYDCVWNKDRPVVDGIIGNRRTLKGFIKRRSHLYRLVSKAYHQLGLADAGTRKNEEDLSLEETWKHGILKQGLERYRTEFNRIANICKGRSISLLVVLIPSRSTIKAILNESSPQPAEARMDHRLPTKHATAIMNELGIRFVDFTPTLAREAYLEATFFRFDGHLTPRSHRLVFEIMKDQCAELAKAE